MRKVLHNFGSGRNVIFFSLVIQILMMLSCLFIFFALDSKQDLDTPTNLRVFARQRNHHINTNYGDMRTPGQEYRILKENELFKVLRRQPMTVLDRFHTDKETRNVIREIREILIQPDGNVALTNGEGAKKWKNATKLLDEKYGVGGIPTIVKIELSHLTLRIRERYIQPFCCNVLSRPKDPLCTKSHQLQHWEEYFRLSYPTFSCDVTIQLGGVGDGAKTICNPHILKGISEKRSCLMLDFGINGLFGFAYDFMSVFDCQVLTFDPTGASGPEFHRKWGLGPCFPSKVPLEVQYGPVSSDWKTNPNVWFWQASPGSHPCHSLKSLSEALEFTSVDVLKMDVEGGERAFFAHMKDEEPTILRDLGVSILLLEYHPRDTLSCASQRDYLYGMISMLEELGFLLYHFEFNIRSGCGAEFGFVRDEYLLGMM